MMVANRTQPQCPRCGYDLRGTAESWREACPIDGRCGECGLAFVWRDIFTEDARAPSWCVEFASRRRLPLAAVRTLAMTVVPWRFWSAVKMTHATRPRRLVLYVVFIALSCYGILAVTNGIFVYKNWYDLFGPRGRGTNTMWIGEATVRSMVLPFSGEPLGTATFRRGGPGYAYIAPRELLQYWWSAWCLLRYGVIVAVLGPLALIGLMASRRRAGVRPRHLVRAFVYSLGWVPLMWASSLAVLLSYHSVWFAGRAPMRWLGLTDYVMMLVIPALILLWWHAAVRRYLRMEHSWAVATAVTVLAMGGALVIMSGVASGFVGHIFTRLGLV